MPTFEGNPFKQFYKRIIQLNQSSNAGVDSTTRELETGDGVKTALSLSDDVLQVKPQSDNTTGTLLVKNTAGDSILAVDTANNKVLAGSSQVSALTQYAYFSATRIDPLSGYHMMIPFQSSHSFGATDSSTEINLGNGADPATTLDVSGEADTSTWSNCYWYAVDAMTVEAVHIIVGGSQSSGDTLGFHLNKFALDITTNHGDLSGGVVIADGGAISNANEDVIRAVSLSVDSNNNTVTAGQILVLTVESDSTDEISVNATVKFTIN